MSLFADTTPDLPPRDVRRNRTGWSILGLALVGITAVAFIPAPYVIEKPGPVFDTLGSVSVEGEEVPLIDIPDAETYETEGTLDMLTVSVAGNREQRPGWFEIAASWLDPSNAVVPLNEIYPEGVTVEDTTTQSNIDMVNSQKQAIAAALTNLGYELPTTLTVAGTQEGAPAEGMLEAGDTIESLNGQTFSDVSELQAAIAANGVEDAASITIVRDGTEATVEIVPTLSSGDAPVPILGISVGNDYAFPIDVKIQLEKVGGPSAGMMFALGIIDKLTPGALNGGENVAGTGTITVDGDVGPIGGIRQKLYGAVDAGAEWFLAPEDNCDEVVGHVPDGLTVFAVGTLDESLAALSAIDTGEGLSALPTCAAQ
ncbi:PDZ domain-containing protein [Glaciihabitans tibetensis]|uniref:endopeptidase La n=1 Tax=Glaciihabitans tibetensis TaxID=1266600 RepID=A0A2T0VGX1_9MICO|nr:S16 family serine protease [Glaciihabitans tibetensis]PRY69449.1 PDZ domain-containing protein [Glaciihabitans tibetensis]